VREWWIRVKREEMVYGLGGEMRERGEEGI
jgi:hypothetical protein